MRTRKRSIRTRVKGDLPICFTQERLSAHGGLEVIRRFLDRSSLLERRRELYATRQFDSDYGSLRMTPALIAMLIVGGKRLRHLAYLEHGGPSGTRTLDPRVKSSVPATVHPRPRASTHVHGRPPTSTGVHPRPPATTLQSSPDSTGVPRCPPASTGLAVIWLSAGPASAGDGPRWRPELARRVRILVTCTGRSTATSRTR